nr:S26 family signal peptidase [Paenibacillus sp. Marseille-P2973]
MSYPGRGEPPYEIHIIICIFKGIFVNDKLFKETNDLGLPDSKLIIKDNEYYVVGDNTGNSIDSRFLGPIPDTQIIGKVVKIFHTNRSNYD